MTSPVDGPDDSPSLTAAIARGGIWTIAGQFAGLGVALVATPFTLRLLGPSQYGVWALLQSAMLWVSLADFGMGGASTRFAGEAHAKDDPRGEATATWTAAGLATVGTAIVAVAVALLAPAIAESILHVHANIRSSAILALRLTAAGVVIYTVTVSLNTPLQVRLQYKTLALISQGTAVLQVIAIPVVLAVFGGGVTAAALVSTTTSGAGLAAVVAVIVRVQPAMRRPSFSRRAAREMLSFGRSLTVAGIADIPLTTAERILLGHYRSTVQVAYYTVATRLASLASMVPAAASQPLFPALVRLQGRGEEAAARQLYSQILQGANLVLTPLLLLVALVAQPFLALWAGRAYGANSTTACFVLLVGVWFQALSWLPLTYLMAIDRGGAVARIRLLEIVPYIVGAALLTSRYGVLGAAIVWTVRALIDSVVFFVLAERFAGLPMSPLTERTGAAIALPALLAAAVIFVSEAAHGLPARAGLAVALLSVYALGAWTIVLVDSERTVMRRLAAQLTSRRKPI